MGQALSTCAGAGDVDNGVGVRRAPCPRDCGRDAGARPEHK